jgi:hypothetical protein
MEYEKTIKLLATENTSSVSGKAAKKKGRFESILRAVKINLP